MNKFAYYKEKSGLSYTQLANMTGISRSLLTKYGNGARDIGSASFAHVAKLAKVLGCSVYDLAGEDKRLLIIEANPNPGCSNGRHHKYLVLDGLNIYDYGTICCCGNGCFGSTPLNVLPKKIVYADGIDRIYDKIFDLSSEISQMINPQKNLDINLDINPDDFKEEPLL